MCSRRGEALVDTLPLDKLDWAIAGTSSYSVSDDGNGEQVTHGRWTHWIDSRAKDAEAASDEGDMVSRPDGSTLETGSMVNPATGRNTAYEELWEDPEPVPAPGLDSSGGAGGGAGGLVVQMEKGRHHRGMVVRVGRQCQGFMRLGDEITAERWEWKEDGGWKRTVKIGDGKGCELPCAKVLLESGEKELGVGDVVLETGDGVWKVVEITKGAA